MEMSYDINNLNQQILNMESEIIFASSRISALETGTYDTTSRVSNVESDIMDIRRYLDYIADTIITLNRHLLNMSDYSAYSYYNKPVRDEYGNIVDAAYDSNYTINQNSVNFSEDELLKIDTKGNIWIDGKIENSAIKIGNKILELAAMYRDNKPFNTMNDII